MDKVSWTMSPKTQIDKCATCSTCGSSLLNCDLDQKSRSFASPLAPEEQNHQQPLTPVRKKFQIRNILEQLVISRETADSLDANEQQSVNKPATNADETVGDGKDALLPGVLKEHTVVSDVAQTPVTVKTHSGESETIKASSVEFFGTGQFLAGEFAQPADAAMTYDYPG